MDIKNMARKVAGIPAKKEGLVTIVVSYSDAHAVEAALRAALDSQKSTLSARGVSVSEIHCEQLYDAEEE